MKLYSYAAIVLSLPLASCGGGSGNNGDNPPPSPSIGSVSVACSPSTIQVNQTSKCSATVTGSGNFDSSVVWSVDNGTIDQTGSYTAASSPTTATVKATSKQDTSRSGTATVTVQAAPQAPSLSIAPSGATVVLGGSSSFNLTVGGSPVPSVSCIVNGAGSVQVSGSTATYSVPLAQPASFSATVNCTATNSSGSSSTSAQISLEYPVPVLTSVTPPAFDVTDLVVITTIQLNGVGFYPGGIVHFGIFGDGQPMPQGVDPKTTQWLIPLPQSSALDLPGWIDISLSTPPGGPGGGTSNTLHFGFLRSYNSLVTLGNSGYQLAPGLGVLQYDLNTGSLLRTGNGVADPNGIAVDDITGDVLESSFVLGTGNVGIFDPSLDFVGGASTSDSQVSQGVAAGNGYGCVSIPGDKSVSVFGPLAMEGPYSSSLPVSITPGTQTGSFPWPTTVTAVGGQPACITYDVTDSVLSAVQATSGGPILGTASIPNLLAYSAAKQQSTTVGWQLVSFNLPTVTITATSQTDPTLSANAVVTIDSSASAVGLSISPASVNGTSASQSQQFTATISGTTNTAVNWLVDGIPSGNSTVGTISTSGLYTLPTFPPGGWTRVTAVSVADPSKSATAYVYYCTTLGSGGPCEAMIGVSPTHVPLSPGMSQQFSAVVAESSNTNVTWLVNGIAGGNSSVGTIDANGNYTAPSSAPAPVKETAVLMSQADGVVVLIDLKTMSELGRVAVPGVLLSITTDVAHGAVVVASADFGAGLTHFYKIDVGSHALSQLNTTSNLLVTGLAVSLDGNSMYVCMRNQCETLPNK